MAVSSPSYGIILNHTINAYGRINNVAGGLNVTDKRYLK